MKRGESGFGSLLVFLGAVLWSLNAPLVRCIELDGVVLCAMRSLIAGVALLPIARLRQVRWSRWTLMYTLSYMGLSLSIIYALKLTDAAIAIGMQYSSIVWLFLIGLAQGKRSTARDAAPVVLVVVGVTLFMVAGSKGGTLKGNLLALSEGVFFLGTTVFSRRAAGDNPIGLTAVANLVTGAVVLAAFRPPLRPVLELDVKGKALLLVLGVLQVGGGYALYNAGLQRVSAARASMLALWEMILGPVWVALFLGDVPAAGVIAGFVIILAGIVLDLRRGDAAGHSPGRQGSDNPSGISRKAV